MTVSALEGTSGAVATKVKVSGVSNCQEPATAGLREGVGESAFRGAENCTEMVASLGTSVVPAAGVTDVTLSGAECDVLLRSCPVEDIGAADALLLLLWTAMAAKPTPTTTTTPAVIATSQPRPPFVP